MRKRLGSGGFTLVELGVTVAIIGVLAAVAVPNIKGFLPRVRLGTATQTLSNELAMARMSAIAKGVESEARFEVGADRYSLVRDGATFAQVVIGPSVDIEALTYLDETTADIQAVRMLNNGRIDIYDGTRVEWRPDLGRNEICVVLREPNGPRKKRVVASMMGRIYTQRWSGGRWEEE